MHTKLQMKKNGPFKIVKKCGNNSYQVNLPPDINLSHIFNVADLYAFKGTDVDVGTLEEPKEQLKKTMPSMLKIVVETILDNRINK